MKNTINLFMTLLALTSLFSISSCTKSNLQENSDDYYTVKFNLKENATKASSITDEDEAAVKNLQVYVFNSSGAVESYVSVDNTKETQLKVSSGKKMFYALVNAPAVDTVSKAEYFKTMITKLEDNSAGSFVMFGCDTVTVNSNTDIALEVKRFVSRIRIQKITAAFTSASLAAASFTVDSIYVINVASEACYHSNAAPQKWLNKMTWKTSSRDDILSEKLTGVDLKNNSSYTKNHSFYVYPNPTTDDSSEKSWSPRHTRLVIQTTLNGKKYYYPVTLPVIDRNKCYTISELTITRPGSESPDEPVSVLTCKISISVSAWDTSLTPYSETI